MRTENPKKRLEPGEYYVTPQSKPEHSPVDKKPYWELVGCRIWGGPQARVRLRWDTWTASDEKLRGFEAGDAEWLTTNKQVATPSVIVSKKLNESRLAEAERAVARLPQDESKNPDSRYQLDDGITFALVCGWNPKAGNTKIEDVIREMRIWLKKRTELSWKNEDHLATMSGVSCFLNHCDRIFGEFTVGVVNSAEYQKAVLHAAEHEPDNYKQLALTGLRRALNYLLDRERISVVRLYSFGLKSEAIPQAMKLLERQQYIDVFWENDFAAAAVARFYMGLRPLSELKKSRAATPWGLSPDLRYYRVPMDSKTGYRPVEVPPVAKKLFEILRDEKRLGILNEHGNYQLHIGNASTWSPWYLKMGYGAVTPALAKNILPRLRKLSDEDAVAEFNTQYPRKYKNSNDPIPCKATTEAVDKYLNDSPRKGSISAYVHATGGMVDSAATYFGNSRKIILAHYLALMSRAEAFLLYQTIPTCLLGNIDPTTIPLPSWAKPELLSAEDKAELEALRAELPKFYASTPSFREKAEVTRRDAIRRFWAAKKSSPDWQRTKEAYGTRAPRFKSKAPGQGCRRNRGYGPGSCDSTGPESIGAIRLGSCDSGRLEPVLNFCQIDF
ncbi:MAG TPA: hypothetical protein VMR33_08155 [Candidatus Baltobacteraceae bacterium]|nr:hypothetical protein [Candidatus Baltobacteraceae bacterium]